MNPRDLPIYALESRLCEACRTQSRVIVQAPTGSGKSTQVPQILLERGVAGRGRIVVLQPRRIATRLLAARVAAERGVRLGGEVGYQIRFDDRSSRDTRIQYVTEGILLRRLLDDPAIADVSVVVFDEFHERHLYSDLTLGRALQVQAGGRPDLKVLVMSATLDTDALERFLAPCAMLRSAGRTFPVALEYASRARPAARPPAVWDLAVQAFEELAAREAEGDVLVFMPGAFEIGQTLQRLRSHPAARGWALFPLHGELAADQQDAAVAPCERRKVIVATNVAETSLTIEGVRWVIDSGLARVARFDPHRGINTLLTERISRASAEQRAGRAGRTAPGVCVRLWTEAEQADRPARDQPEVRRVDLAETLLALHAAGLGDWQSFPWFDPPDAKAVAQAEGVLADLGALDAGGGLTPLGRRMAVFPVHPRYSRMLLAASERGCVPSAALAAALTQDRSLLLRRPGEGAGERREREWGDEEQSDFFLLMRAYRHAEACGFDVGRCQALGIHAAAARQVQRARAYFLELARGQGLTTEEGPDAREAVRQCLLLAFADRVARRLDGGTLRCGLVHRRAGVLDRDSVVRASPLLVAADVRELEGRKGELEVRLSLATAVERAWLDELFPGAVREESVVFWDAAARRVAARRDVVFRDLVLESRRAPDPPPEAAAPILAEEVLRGAVAIQRWDDAVEQWIHRVNLLARVCPELGLAAIAPDDRRDMMAHICLGAYSARDLKDKPVWPVLRAWLSAGQGEVLDRHAPERLALPGGARPKLVYAADGAPTVAARIQELYGVRGSLRVAMDRVAVTIQVLAPNYRPVQITSDLAAFWRDEYPKVKKELQRKYPKHEWR